ncbi:hypothetical protein TJA_07560 [Thermus sp. LT1-2-5]|uniref:PaaI family thioesterase n=1 Tax=Thermus sp. LT1-2-5 TaxID=3026935 RepID=UPI0030E79506
MDPKALAEQVAQAQPFTQHLGAEVVRVEGGMVEFALQVRPEFYQHLGVVHGGVISALLDNALTFAGGLALGPQVLTVEFKVNFLRPAKGTRLRAVGRVVHAGKRLAVVQGEAYSEEPEPRLIALAQGTISQV